MQKPVIGIRPIIDGRMLGVREELEDQTMDMAKIAAKLISDNLFYPDGTHVECVIADTTIGGGAEATRCADKFSKYNICGTLSVTPCWCYGTETIDLDPYTVKAVWGFNGTERPGAVYLAAIMAAHAHRGLPAFAIYGHDVQDKDDLSVPGDVKEKILRFARGAIAVGLMRNKAYVSLGGVAMGIAGSILDPIVMQKYFGLRAEWVDMTEIIRREKLGIYDKEEYEKEREWIRKNCKKGLEVNVPSKINTPEQDEAEWDFIAKMTIIIKDIMLGNPKLADIGWIEESNGRNAIVGGFQGQRQWTDFMPNADFTEAILNTSFDWNGKRQPTVLATENDTMNGMAMLLLHLLSDMSPIFSDVRTYWSPEAVERVTGYKPEGLAANGFMHLLNSGASALDGSGAMKDDQGNSVMKRWWEVTDQDIKNVMESVKWAPANKGYFRGGGFSSQYSSQGTMPITMARLNLVDGLGPVLQIAEGWTVELPNDVDKKLLMRTDPTWPSLWFVPRLDPGNNAFKDVYSVMANWGANHGASVYGHVGADLITLASMLRIPVSMHNIQDGSVFRPHSWSAFGTKDLEAADYRACTTYGPLYG